MNRPRGGRRLGRDFFGQPVLDAAPLLLNKVLVAADGRSGRIVEVEAYHGEQDPASHAYRGRTPRNATMFLPGGHLYVYLSYGIHSCANLVFGPEGDAQAVLLRALEPLGGAELMRAARWRQQHRQDDRDLCRGPGRLCEAMGIGRSLDGMDLTDRGASLWVTDDGIDPPNDASRTARVGISAGQDRLWRFSVPGHAAVSRSAGTARG